MRRVDLDEHLLDVAPPSTVRALHMGRNAPPVFKFPPGMTELGYLEAVARGDIDANPRQLAAVRAAAAYKYSKVDKGGKKEAAKRAATAAIVSPLSRFGAPELGRVGGMVARPVLRLVVNQ